MITSLGFASDEELNIYWFSSTIRRHSQEVINNQKVAGAITLPQTPQDSPRGLQFQGRAKQLTDSTEIEQAISIFEGRIFSRETIDKLTQLETKSHRFYKLTSTQSGLFDAVNFPNESRQELNL